MRLFHQICTERGIVAHLATCDCFLALFTLFTLSFIYFIMQKRRGFYHACHGRKRCHYEKIGEQKTDEAKEDFTFLIIVNVIVAIVMCAAGYLAMDSIFARMNLSADVEGYCVEYLSRYLIFTVPNCHVYIHQAIFSTKVLRWLEKIPLQ